MRLGVLVVGLCGALCADAADAHASPLDMFGFGAKSPALAGTGVAETTEYDSLFLNPAGLAFAAKRLTFGVQTGRFALEMNGKDTETDPPNGFIFGGTLPIPLGGSLRDRVGLGVAVHFPARVINRARAPLPGVPTYALLESRAQVVSLQIGLGGRINDRWSIGATVMVLAALGGTIDISADPAGRFMTQSEQELVSSFSPILGARYHMPERDLQLGATLRGVSRSDFDMLVTNTLGESLPLTIPTIRFAGVSQYDPLTLALEASWQPRPRLRLAAQLSYQRWSAYPLPTKKPVEGAPDIEEPGFHDIVIPRLAVEYTLRAGATTIALRGGYFFAMSPAPAQDGQQSLLDNHRNVLSAGIGLAWLGLSSPVHLDLWTQLHLLAPRRHTKNLDNFTPGDTLYFYTIETGGMIYVGGLSLGVDL